MAAMGTADRAPRRRRRIGDPGEASTSRIRSRIVLESPRQYGSFPIQPIRHRLFQDPFDLHRTAAPP